jgi:hypothetical protein
MLSSLMMIFLQSGDKQKAILVFDKLQKVQNKIVGEPDVLPLQLFVDACIQDSNADLAIVSLYFDLFALQHYFYYVLTVIVLLIYRNVCNTVMKSVSLKRKISPGK